MRHVHLALHDSSRPADRPPAHAVQESPACLATGVLEAGLRGVSFCGLVAAIERIQVHAPDTAARLYQLWIEANPDDTPYLFAAWFNLGAALSAQGIRDSAIHAYRRALALKPDFHPAAINLGLALESAGLVEPALAVWKAALPSSEAQTALLNHRARLLERLDRLDEAERTLHASIAIDHDQPDAIQHWLHLRQRMCLWPALPPGIPCLPPAVLLDRAGPLAALALTDDVSSQFRAAAAWVDRKTTASDQRLSPIHGYRHQRLRIGYLSSDFCRHAMSFLVAELFERQDRTRFELYAYCSSPDDGSDIRRRILAAFDHVRLVRTVTDEAAARSIREDEIDVLIDLNGLTAGARPQILRWKPAPVQATYLGFIGPVPVPEIDYLFSDDWVIPPAHRPRYAEGRGARPLAIGPSYQVNDTRRAIGAPLTRAECGLPSGRFVLCCFSNHYKITEAMFAGWMEILRAASNTVLWLAGDNPWSAANLRAAALAASVDSDRLIFAERTDPATYMSRLALADLFLDTFPYNAGTVASDALRMQVPIVTLCGQSFASRMAARFLHAIGAGDGVAASLADFVATATRLATDPVAYRAYRARFTTAAWRGTLGDVEQFTREYEAALERIAIRPEATDAVFGPTPVA